MSDRPRTPRSRGRRPRPRRHHADRAFRGATFIELTAEEIMLDLDPGWPVLGREGAGS